MEAMLTLPITLNFFVTSLLLLLYVLKLNIMEILKMIIIQSIQKGTIPNDP